MAPGQRVRVRASDVRARKLVMMLVMLLSLGVYYVIISGVLSGDPAKGCQEVVSGSAVVLKPGQVSRWQRFDWLPPRDKTTLLNNFVHHKETAQWAAGERTLSCSPDVDDIVEKAVNIVRRHIRKDYINPVADPAKAVPLFEEAIAKSPSCYTARLNLAILLPVTSKNPLEDLRRVETNLLADFPTSHPLHAKSLLWKAISVELQGAREKEAHELYFRAFNAEPNLALLYFGRRGEVFKELKKQVSLFKDQRMSKEEGKHLQTTALKKILLYYEYARHFAGYNHVTKEQAAAFHDVWFMIVKDIVPPYVLKSLQDCFRGLISGGILKFDDKQAKRYFHYNSPPARFIAAVLTDFVSNVWDTEMKSTYTYMGGYPGGSELKPHVDRAQCEITMSLAVDVNPGEEACPIGARLEPKKLTKQKSIGANTKSGRKDGDAYLYPKAGDAVMFRGRGIVHWRDPIPQHMNCTNVFMHWVRSDFAGKID